MKTYQTSIDYTALFDLIKEGKEIVGFIYDGGYQYLCEIESEGGKDWRIKSQLFQESDPNGRTEEYFISECQRLNLEWIVPNDTIIDQAFEYAAENGRMVGTFGIDKPHMKSLAEEFKKEKL